MEAAMCKESSMGRQGMNEGGGAGKQLYWPWSWGNDYYLNSAAFKVCDTELVTAFSAFGFFHM